MVTSFSSLWLKSIKRLTKAPRAKGRQLVKSAVTKTVSALVNTAVGVKKRTPVGSTTRRVPMAKLLLPSAVQARHPGIQPLRIKRGLPPAGAMWRKAYFSTTQTPRTSVVQRMAYWLYIPTQAASAAEKNGPMPLVVLLHGCKQTAPDIASVTRMNVLAERKGFAVLYPHQSLSADRNRCWPWYKRSVQSGKGDVAMLAKMIAQLQKHHHFDSRRTYAAGLSAGAALATILALRHPELIAALGLHSAPVFATSDSALSAYRTMQYGAPHAHGTAIRQFLAEQVDFPGLPVIVIHGDDDAVVRRINAQELVQQFLLVNAHKLGNVEPARRRHTGSGTALKRRLAHHTDTWYAKRKPYVVSCTVNGLGHAWSGGDPATAFSEPRGPNASLMMWQFFQHHQRKPDADIDPAV